MMIEQASEVLFGLFAVNHDLLSRPRALVCLLANIIVRCGAPEAASFLAKLLVESQILNFIIFGVYLIDSKMKALLSFGYGI